MCHGESSDFGSGPKLVVLYFFEFNDIAHRDELREKLKENLDQLDDFEFCK